MAQLPTARIGGRIGRALDALGYYRKITQFGHRTAYTQVRTFWNIPGLSKPVRYECEGGIEQFRLLKNPETSVGTLKRMLYGIIKGKVVINIDEVPEAEEAFRVVESRHPKLKGLISQARTKIPRPADSLPITPPVSPDTISESTIEPADVPETAAEESGIRYSDESLAKAIVEEHNIDDDADTEVTTRPTARPSSVEVDDDAPTLRRPVQAPAAGAQAQPAPRPEGNNQRVYFASEVTQIIGNLSTSEARTLQTMEGDSASIIRKLTTQAQVLQVRVRELETKNEAEAQAIIAFVGKTEAEAKSTVVDIFNARKILPLDIATGKILDYIEETYPSLKTRIASLRTILQGGRTNA